MAVAVSDRLYLRLDDDPLYAPETTVPAGTLREFAVAAALHEHVAHAMSYDELLPAGAEVTERVLPDGALRLIVDLQADAAVMHVVGPSTSPVLLTMRGRLRGLSITLRPGAAPALFGIAAHELARQSVPWQDLAPAPLRSLPCCLQAAASDDARMGLLFDTLQAGRQDSQTQEQRQEQRTAQLAARLITRSAGGRSVRELAQTLGLGERRLQQIFRSQVGLSPRAWGRLARLQGCLRLLRRPVPPRWAELAVEAGFYDQSHLINEFRSLCGVTPEAFVSRSSKTAR